MKGSCSNSQRLEGNLLVFTTTNENKFFEVRTALGATGIPLRSLQDFGSAPHVEETGTSFAENAKLKAEAYYEFLQKPVLAEDSGLVIPALGGYPGIASARIADTDEERIRIILDKLKVAEDRLAYYVCNVYFISAEETEQVEATCHGSITESPMGTLGFGYDPIFKPDGSARTFGQMSVREKANYSHRAKAVRLLLPRLLSAFRLNPTKTLR
jgi:XTP/dITP diphosphohydrolase